MYLSYYLWSVFAHATFLFQISGSLPLSAEEGCQEEQFRCSGDGTCVPKAWVCDYSYDCNDKSDEVGCETDSETTQHPVKTSCKDDEFMCVADNYCISKDWVCDKAVDCIDDSDELNCSATQCREDEVRCKMTGHCIRLKWVCDGESDCIDNSDEENCSQNTPSTIAVSETTEKLTPTTNADFSDLQSFLESHKIKFLSPNSLIDNFLESKIYQPKQTTNLPILESSAAIETVSANDAENHITDKAYIVDQDKIITTWNTADTTAHYENSDNKVGEISNFSQKPPSYDAPNIFQFPKYPVDKEFEGVDLADVETSWLGSGDSSSNSDLYSYSESASNLLSTTFPTLPTTTLYDAKTTEETLSDASPSVSLITLETLSSTTITSPTKMKTTQSRTTPTTTTTTPFTTTTTTTPFTTTTPTTTTFYLCKRGEFFCKSDNICIPVEWRCDRTEDCWDGSDERNCHLVRCPSEMVQCKDTGRCIFVAWLCDGATDCEDGSDENLCK